MKLMLTATVLLLASVTLVVSSEEDDKQKLEQVEKRVEHAAHIIKENEDENHDEQVGSPDHAKNGLSITQKATGVVTKDDRLSHFFMNTRPGAFILWLTIKFFTTRFRIQWMFGRLIWKFLGLLGFKRKTQVKLGHGSDDGYEYAKKMDAVFWNHFKNPSQRHIQNFDEEQERQRAMNRMIREEKVKQKNGGKVQPEGGNTKPESPNGMDEKKAKSESEKSAVRTG